MGTFESSHTGLSGMKGLSGHHHKGISHRGKGVFRSPETGMSPECLSDDSKEVWWS